MNNDPGLFTDSTGSGMAGAEDVSFNTQQNLKSFSYNGSRTCKSCGLYNLSPVQALYSDLCPKCKSRAAKKQVEGGMA